jgi:hypothetical protein
MKYTIPSLLAALLLGISPGVARAICYDPANYGAIGGDGLDDSLAVQMMLNLPGSAKCIEFSSVLEFAKRNGIRESVKVPSNTTIRGIGAGTGFRMIGPGFRQTWVGMRVVGANVNLLDFEASVDPLVYDTEEQTHVIEVTGPSRDVIIDRIRLTNAVRKKPDNTDWPGGDCIRTAGEEGHPGDPEAIPPIPYRAPERVEGVTITRTIMNDCDRSGYAAQRATYGLIYTANTCRRVGDQCFDAELTGTGNACDWVITSNIFLGGKQGNFDASIHSATGMICNVVFAGNIMRRGLLLRNVEGVAIAGNVIANKGQSNEPTLWLSKTVRYGALSGNSVRRVAAVYNADGTVKEASMPGPVLGILDHGTGTTTDTSIAANAFVQQTPSWGMQLRGGKITFTANRVTTVQPATPGAIPAPVSAVQVETSANAAPDLLVDQNTFTGIWARFAGGAAATQVVQQQSGNRMVQ